MKKSLQLLIVAMLFSLGISQAQEYALAFDTTGRIEKLKPDVVTIPQIDDVMGDNARTFDLWFKAKVEQAEEPLFIQYGVDDKDATSGFKFTVRLQDKTLVRVEHAFGFIIGSTPVADNEWHHLAVCVDKSTGIHDTKVYIDGAYDSISSKSATNNLFNTTPSDIWLSYAVTKEGYEIYSRRFNGVMDELRIWKKALSMEEVIAVKDSFICAENYPDLVAYYRFNENTGVNLADETGTYDAIFGITKDGTDTEAHPSWTDGLTTLKGEGCPEPKGIFRHDASVNASIYPNPAGNQIQIKSELSVNKVIVYNVLGNTALELNSPELNTVNISSLKSGVYLMKVEFDNSKVGTFRFIKE